MAGRGEGPGVSRGVNISLKFLGAVLAPDSLICCFGELVVAVILAVLMIVVVIFFCYCYCYCQ